MIVRTLSPVLCLLATGSLLAQDPAKDLTVADVFSLEAKMRVAYPRPLAWLDDDHYLAFDAVRGSDKGFLKISAVSGEAAPLFDHGKMVEALAMLPGFDKANAKVLVADRSVFQWNLHHSAMVLHVAGDLIYYDPYALRARRLTHTPGDEVGHDFSPDGKMVAFVHDHDLFVVGVDLGAPRPLTTGGHEDLLYGRLDWVYQEELYGRGNFKGFWWSPDSTRIALLRLDESPVKEFTLVSDTPTRPLVEVTNYPKAGDPNPNVALGVVPARGGDVRYFDLSRYGNQEILISRVAWHPDGKEVWFQVQDREQRWLDLLAGDAATGKVRLALRERSQSWVLADANPIWIAGGREFLWMSERDGWKHLYRYRRDGSLQLRLSGGEFEVDEVASIDAKLGLVYFVTNRSGILDRQLWRMDLDGKGAVAVTRGAGWHSAVMSPGATRFVHTWTSWNTLQGAEICNADGKVVRKIAACDMSALDPFKLNPVEFVTVKNREGFVMEAKMIKPRGWKKGVKSPVMCFTYSGPHAPQVRNRWGRARYLWHQMLAQKGYLIWVCDNRSASGKGLRSAAACFKNMGTTETHDLEDGVKWLVDQGLADPSRIGIWGWSYGGYQTSFCLTHSKIWTMGIAVNPVTDWRFYDSIYTERYMGLPQTNPGGYASSSVVRAAKDLHGKLLLVAATMDDNVHMQNSLQFVHALQMAGKQFRFMVYPRVRHGIGDAGQQRHLYQMMTSFVLENL